MFEDFESNDFDAVGELKRQIRDWFDKSPILNENPDIKTKLLVEMGDNHFDERFGGKQFIEKANSYSVHVWAQKNFELAEFWKQIALANASINDNPHITADTTVSRFKENFKVK